MCDFGCGVGRLSLPFAEEFNSVVATDVSRAMLEEGRKLAKERRVMNILWTLTDDNLTRLPCSFDLVHSYIVFQHIPVAKGLKFIRLLSQKVVPGGVIAFHVVYSNRKRRLLQLAKKIPFFWYLLNFVRQRPLSEPPMQMNPYPLDKILEVLQDAGIRELNFDLTNHGHGGCVISGQKPDDQSFKALL